MIPLLTERDFFMALHLKTFATRTITATVFVAILLFCIWCNYLSFSILFFVVALWGLREFYQLSKKLGAKPYQKTGLLLSALLYGCCWFSNTHLALCLPIGMELILPCLCLLIFFVIMIVGLWEGKPNSVLNSVYTISGIVYAVMPFCFLLGIPCINTSFMYSGSFTGKWYDDMAPYNYHYVLGLVLLIWSNDVFAYLVGSLIGKHKLYERISPGKTWEGSIGAFVLTMGSAWLISKYYTELAIVHWMMISIIVCVLGTVGDLIESMMKRQAGVKDSGTIMPGHGGILDRFDSLLFAAPFIYMYLLLVTYFGALF